MKPIRVAILGPGRIAHTMARTLQGMEDAEAWAVASRDLARAEEFAAAYGIPKSYGSYEEMLRDPDVDLVYIATPHALHAEQAVQCLRAGKPVLCEKAFAVNARETKAVLDCSRETGVLVAEAIWPRYMPMARTIREFCESGVIGKITSLTANLAYAVWHKERLRDPQMAGGALLDIGIYPLTFASVAFGDDVVKIEASGQLSDQGVDTQETMILTWRDGRTATLYSSAVSAGDRRGMISGEKGYAVVENVNNYESLSVYDTDHKLIRRVEKPPQITGFEYQVRAAAEALRKGQIECPDMTHAQILGMMEWMDRVRELLGVRYPMEG